MARATQTNEKYLTVCAVPTTTDVSQDRGDPMSAKERLKSCPEVPLPGPAVLARYQVAHLLGERGDDLRGGLVSRPLTHHRRRIAGDQHHSLAVTANRCRAVHQRLGEH